MLPQFFYSYFSDSATQEILDEFKPIVYPLGPTTNDMDGFEWFLPIALPPEKAHLGYKLWLEDFMGVWKVCNNSPVWEPVSYYFDLSFFSPCDLFGRVRRALTVASWNSLK